MIKYRYTGAYDRFVGTILLSGLYQFKAGTEEFDRLKDKPFEEMPFIPKGSIHKAKDEFMKKNLSLDYLPKSQDEYFGLMRHAVFLSAGNVARGNAVSNILASFLDRLEKMEIRLLNSVDRRQLRELRRLISEFAVADGYEKEKKQYKYRKK